MPPLRLCLHLMCLRWFVWHRWGSDATCALVLEYLAIDTSCFLLTEKTHVPTESYSSLLWPHRTVSFQRSRKWAHIRANIPGSCRKKPRPCTSGIVAHRVLQRQYVHVARSNGKSHLSVLARRHLGCRGDPFGARGSIPRLMERSSSTLGFSAGLRPRQTLSKSQEGNPSVEVADPAPPRFRTRASTAK